MKVLMDEARFEEPGVVVRMRKSTGEAPKLPAKDARGERAHLDSVI
jgi:hypothetical protein